MGGGDTPGDPPVTLLVTRRVRAGDETEFQAVMNGISATAGTFPGFLGKEVFRSVLPGAVDYRVAVRFRRESDLRRMQDSEEFRTWLARAEALAEARVVERVNGLEAWFTLPEQHPGPPPPRWKMMLASAVGIYPMISLMPLMLGPLVAHLPRWLGNLVTVAVLMPLMTWGVMPLVTRVLRPWLYPTPGVSRSGHAR